ncbi:hypothetical protein [Mesorhizobium sp. NPDC059025]|uniref:hypothetical protein n=1 Tax=unclassified Mesorhizobium TaxID=325217 RepID=UPI0036A7A5FD
MQIHTAHSFCEQMRAIGQTGRPLPISPVERSMPTDPPEQLMFRRVRADVRAMLFDVLRETRRCSPSTDSEHMIPKSSPPSGWRERSGASWAGLLKTVEQKLRSVRMEYRDLIMTATDGHKTWNMPLTVTIHLITSKILAANSAARAATRFQIDR